MKILKKQKPVWEFPKGSLRGEVRVTAGGGRRLPPLGNSGGVGREAPHKCMGVWRCAAPPPSPISGPQKFAGDAYC